MAVSFVLCIQTKRHVSVKASQIRNLDDVDIKLEPSTNDIVESMGFRYPSLRVLMAFISKNGER